MPWACYCNLPFGVEIPSFLHFFACRFVVVVFNVQFLVAFTGTQFEMRSVTSSVTQACQICNLYCTLQISVYVWKTHLTPRGNAQTWQSFMLEPGSSGCKFCTRYFLFLLPSYTSVQFLYDKLFIIAQDNKENDVKTWLVYRSTSVSKKNIEI